MKKLILCLIFSLSLIGTAFAESGWVGDHASDIKTDTLLFDNNLSILDDTVQKALETLDELVAGAGLVSDTAYGVGWNGVTTIAPSKNSVYDKIESLILGSGAPTNATYITQTPDGTLSAEQALSLLGTGLVKNNTATGVLSIATPDVDYLVTLQKDLVAGTGLSGGANDILPGADADVNLSIDTTEIEATTWGAGGNASNIWTFNLSGTDITVTFGSDLVTFSSSLTLGTGKDITLGTTQWNSGDSIDATKVANADLGDITSTGGVWAVKDDSHAHTSTTLPATTSYLGNSIQDAEVDNNITLDNITQITNRSHTALTDIGTNNHAQLDNFVASKGQASGIASLDSLSLVVENPANATATPTASKIPIADGSAKLDGWISLGNTITESELSFSNNTTANASTSAHGLLPLLDNNSAHYLNGQGAWTTPSGGSQATGDTLTIQATTDTLTTYFSLYPRIELNELLSFIKTDEHAVSAYHAIINGFVDVFSDETGVDTATSTNESYDSVNDLYQPSTSDNAVITQTTFNISLVTVGDAVNDEYRAAQSFQLSAQKTISKLTLRTGTVSGSFSGNITCTIETDNSNAPSGTLADANATQAFASPGANTVFDVTFPGTFTLSASTKYWIRLNCSNQSTDVYVNFSGNDTSVYPDGNIATQANGGAWSNGTGDLYFVLYEAQRNNMTLVSNAYTATTANPNKGFLVLQEEDVDSITINTDLKGWMSRDGGTTYSQATLTNYGTVSGRKILAGTVDLSGQPSGSSIKWKVETLSNKNLKVHGDAGSYQ